jgi:hypothetical protein
MWMHHDYGWWGFVIAIVGLGLAYPIDVLAHLTAPIVKNWWAERSVASMRKRIEKLEKQLADEEQNYPLLSVVEEQLFKGIVGLAALGMFGLQFLVICFLLAVGHFLPTPLTAHNAVPGVGLPLFVFAGGYAILFAVFGKLTAFRKERSPSERNALKKSIEELKKQLAQRTGKP